MLPSIALRAATDGLGVLLECRVDSEHPLANTAIAAVSTRMRIVIVALLSRSHPLTRCSTLQLCDLERVLSVRCERVLAHIPRRYHCNDRLGRTLLRTHERALDARRARGSRPAVRALAGADADGRRAACATPTSRTTTSTDRSAASPACRCCGRWAACCRRTGSSARCRRSAAIGCRAATPRSASSSSPATICPVGVSRRHRIGIDHVGLNCAVCHSGTVRDTPTSAPRLVLGMPAHQLDLQGFVQFVLECTLDSAASPPRPCGPRSRAMAAPTRSSGCCCAPA